MKRSIFLLILNGLFLSGHAQSPKWEVYIGLSNRNEAPNALVEYYDKGYYIVGHHWITTSSVKGWDIKTNINGSVLWQKTMTYGQNTINGIHVRIDNEGNRYIGGSIAINDQPWPFVAKFNACGEKIWCRALTKQAYRGGWVRGMILNKNNEIIVSMSYSSTELIDEIFMMGFRADGIVLWQNTYARFSNYPLLRNPVIYSMIEHNNEYFLSGSCYWPYPNNPGHFFLRPFFIGIDGSYNEKWILPFYALGSIYGIIYNSIPLNDSVLMGVGIRRLPGERNNSLLAFYKITGEELGFSQVTNEQISPTNFTNHTRNIKRINDSLFITYSHFGPNVGSNSGGHFVIDTVGRLFNYLSKPNTSSAYSPMIKAADNNYVVASQYQAGSSMSDIAFYKIDQNLQSVPFDASQHVYDILCPYPIQSGNIDMSDCMVLVATDNIPTPDKYYASIRTIPITVYPNPARDIITFAFENTDHHKKIVLKCYSLLGRQHYENRIVSGQKESTTYVSAWPAGMYVAIVYSEGQPVGRAKFVVGR